jgi:hypothetical protein
MPCKQPQSLPAICEIDLRASRGLLSEKMRLSLAPSALSLDIRLGSKPVKLRTSKCLPVCPESGPPRINEYTPQLSFKESDERGFSGPSFDLD